MLDELPIQAEVLPSESDDKPAGEQVITPPVTGYSILPVESELPPRVRYRSVIGVNPKTPKRKRARMTEAQLEVRRKSARHLHEMIRDGVIDHPSRPRISGLRAFLRKGKIPNQTIDMAVKDYVRRSIEELGGEAEIGVGQLAMIAVQRVVLSSILLLENDMMRMGTISTPEGDLRPYIKLLQGHAATFRVNQQALGLAKARTKERKPPRLQELLTEAKEALSGS